MEMHTTAMLRMVAKTGFGCSLRRVFHLSAPAVHPPRLSPVGGQSVRAQTLTQGRYLGLAVPYRGAYQIEAYHSAGLGSTSPYHHHACRIPTCALHNLLTLPGWSHGAVLFCMP